MDIIKDAAKSSKRPVDIEPQEGEPTPTETERPPPCSRLALRDDGALLVSLEDAPDRDTTGREVVAFMVLSSEEAAAVRASTNEALSGAAAHTLGRLPKKGNAQR